MDTDYRMVRIKDGELLLDLLKTVSGEADSLPQSPVEIAGIDKEEAEAVLSSALRKSIITGAFSLVSEAIRLDLMPHMRIN